jgi:alpha-L-rhamnosidase
MKITRLRFEHLTDALGIGVDHPRLSWQYEDAPSGWKQAAHEIEARADAGEVAWSSGRVESSESVLVSWPGVPLRSRERVSVRVRAWGADGSEVDWCEPSVVEAGLLGEEDWHGSFVGPAWEQDASKMEPSPLVRRAFTCDGAISRARLYATALGVYELELNGERVGDHVLAPGWSSYNSRLRYQTFDVTGLLRPGENAVGAMLGDGWYRGLLGFPGVAGRCLYGEEVALLAQLEVTYADGRRQLVTTDNEWKAAPGPILSSGIYEGETYDARLERDGWSSPGFDDTDWTPVKIVQHDLSTIVAPPGPPVRAQEPLAPVKITTSPSGKAILDFGQNATGRLRIKARGEAGRTITMRHAEILIDAELCTEPLRAAAATDQYTLRGGGVETWEPRFTFHGFRYAEITGWPGELTPDDVRFVVCHSDMERTGWFECSDPMVNRLHENALWSMKSNFLDVPTDCPQRDERLGWTGDLTVFSPSACFLYDASGVLTNWLADLAADQDTDTGVVPIVIPALQSREQNERARGMMGLATAVWGDAAVIVPSVMHERFGDAAILDAQYESMRAWVECVAGLAGPGRVWAHGFQFADWLDPSAPPDDSRRAMTDTHLVATAYFYRVTGLLSRAAAVLGKEDDQRRYERLASEIRQAFVREYVTPSGRVVSDSQTAYSLCLVFGLLETDEQRQHAGERLAALVRNNGYHVGVGFVGVAIVTDALVMAGYPGAAYSLLTQTTCPSWLYPITQGATTIWERWDSLKPDGSVNSSNMTSFNHYAMGSVVDFLHRRVGGLAPLEPGYRRIEVAPVVGGGLTWAESRHMTPYGLAASKWRLEDGGMRLDVLVPTGTTARVVPPDGREAFEVESGSHSFLLKLAAGVPV